MLPPTNPTSPNQDQDQAQFTDKLAVNLNKLAAELGLPKVDEISLQNVDRITFAILDVKANASNSTQNLTRKFCIVQLI